MMATSTLLSGFFALSCGMQDIDPHTHQKVGDEHALSYMARDGKGTLIGWSGLEGQGNVSARIDRDGTVILAGTAFKGDDAETWAVLHPVPDSLDFEMEWLMHDTASTDGRDTVVIWSKGRCERIGHSEANTQ